MRRATAAIVVACTLITVADPTPAKAQVCESYTVNSSAEQPMSFTILDTDVGTEAYQRLVSYSSGGHAALGMAISAAYDYFGVCEYAGIGIADGSGGNGYRPNYTIYVWRSGVDETSARQSVYALIGASAQPVITNGDCAISCDGSVQGTPTTTTTQPPVVESTPSDSNVAAVDQPATADATQHMVQAQVIRGEYVIGHPDASSALKRVNKSKQVVKAKRALRKRVVMK
jgi:hypothetical protein